MASWPQESQTLVGKSLTQFGPPLAFEVYLFEVLGALVCLAGCAWGTEGLSRASEHSPLLLLAWFKFPMPGGAYLAVWAHRASPSVPVHHGMSGVLLAWHAVGGMDSMEDMGSV